MLRLVDLTFDIYDKAPTFSPDPKTAVLPHLRIEDLSYNITQLIMSTHLGTHVDAPYHFFDDGVTVDQVDARRALGMAQVLDLSHKCAGQEITVTDLLACHRPVSAGSRLIIRTGCDTLFPAEGYFRDTPYLGVEACRWIASQGVTCLATDLPSINMREYAPAHQALLNRDAQVLIIEGLRGLERLRGGQVILIALFLRVRGRDGAPSRALAIDGEPGQIERLGNVLQALDYVG